MLTKEQMPILRPLPVRKRGERRRYELMEDWYCNFLGKDFIIPKGFIFDGASIPRLLWNLLSPAGYLFLPGLWHDFVYKYRFIFTSSAVESLDGGDRKIIKEFFTQEEADQRFEAIADIVNMGAHFFTRAAYLSLRAFGFVAWGNHRKKNTKCTIEPKGYESFGLKRSA